MIKNSGILFVFYFTILYFLITRENLAERIKEITYVVLTSGGAWLIWEGHIGLVYSNANVQRHSMSASYMSSIFASKSSEQISQIGTNFLHKWFSINVSYEWQILFLYVIIIGVALIISEKGERIKSLKLPIIILGFYLIYKVCLVGMYLFNMPAGDAESVAGYERYQYTFTVLILFSVAWHFVTYIDKKIELKSNLSYKYIGTLFATLVSLVVIFMTFPIKEYIRPNYEEDGVHRQLTSMLKNKVEGISVGDKVIAYNTYRWASFFVRFSMENQECMSSNDITIIREVLDTNNDGYQYLTITSDTEEIKDLLISYGYPEDTKCIKLDY